MAIYHFSSQVISRKAGRSAVAAAAYRAGVKMTDERTGEVFDYSRKRVLGGGVFLPGGSTIDRAELWNKVEAHHKRGDAVVARDFEISLPRELTEDQRQALAFEYARELADRYGVAVDVNLHPPDRVTDRDLEVDPDRYHEVDPETNVRHNGNWHMHILLSACYVDAEGKMGKKAVELDPIHCQRAKIKNSMDEQRPRWAELCNAHLERAGHAVRIDHRSLSEQGIDRAPTSHHGVHARAVERKTGERSDRRLADETALRERAQAAALEKARDAALAAQIAVAEREAAQLERELARELEGQQRQAAAPAPTQSSADLRRAIEQAEENLRRQGKERISQDPRVRAAHQAAVTSWETHKAAHDQAQQASQLVKSRGGRMKQCRQLAGEWRRSNRFRAWWHDHVRTVATLASLEADARQATGRWEKAKDAAAQTERRAQAALASYESKRAELDQVKKDVAMEVVRGQRHEWAAVRELEAKFNDAQHRENEIMYQQSLEFDPEPLEPPQERSRDDYELDR